MVLYKNQSIFIGFITSWKNNNFSCFDTKSVFNKNKSNYYYYDISLEKGSYELPKNMFLCKM